MTDQTAEKQLKYHRVMTDIAQSIRQGKYGPGQKLPPLRDLARTYHVNIMTAHKAVKGLADDGLVDLRPGSGSFVAQHQDNALRVAIAFRRAFVRVDKHHPVLGAAMAGADLHGQDSGAHFQTCFFDRECFTEQVGMSLLNDRIQAVVSIGGGLNAKDYAFLAEHNIHAAQYGYITADDDWMTTVTLDYPRAMDMLISHLRGIGHERIAFLSWQQSGDGGMIHRVFQDLAFQYRMGNASDLLVKIDNPPNHIHWDDIEKFFSISPRPDAVIVSDEYLANTLLAACEQYNIAVPRDLSVAAINDMLPQGHMPLTTTYSIEEIVGAIRQACDIVVQQMRGDRAPGGVVKVPPNLRCKASILGVPGREQKTIS